MVSGRFLSERRKWRGVGWVAEHFSQQWSSGTKQLHLLVMVMNENAKDEDEMNYQSGPSLAE